jgi:hypothetical protein
MKKQTDDLFTKIAGKLLTDVRDLVGWGIEGGHTTAEQLRLTIAARRETASNLVKGGMSQRQAAKELGVDHKTVQRDLAQSAPQDGEKRATKAERRAQREIVFAARSSGTNREGKAG